MAAKKSVDRIQAFSSRLEMSIANTGVIERIPTSYSTKDAIGLEIVQVDWYPMTPDERGAEMQGGFDFIRWGLSQLYRAGACPEEPDEAGIVDFENLTSHEITAIGTQWLKVPFTWKPAEPILVHPASLYVFVNTGGLVNPGAIAYKMWYRYVDLTPQEFQDILQTVVMSDVL